MPLSAGSPTPAPPISMLSWTQAFPSRLQRTQLPR
jgi:hypothetical protein